MTGFHKAMLKFWGQFTINGRNVPAFQAGRVPDFVSTGEVDSKGNLILTPLTFPYITFECAIGSFGGKNVLTAFNWHQEQSGVNVMAERAALLDQIARAIPIGGAILEWDGGGAVLYRNSNNFQSYYDTEPEKSSGLPVLGGRTSYIINYYNV